MATEAQIMPPKAIIMHRSLSLNKADGIPTLPDTDEDASVDAPVASTSTSTPPASPTVITTKITTSTTSAEDPKSSKTHKLKPSLSMPNCAVTTSTTTTLKRVHTQQTIQFAPLPEISPRRRKSSVPLGVAARSRMIQNRRNAAMNAPRPQPVWTELDEEAVNGKATEMEEEDPFEVFGRYVMDKSKTFWRRVASKGDSKDKKPDEKERDGKTKRRPREQHFYIDATDQEPLPGMEEGEGRVWEEDVTESELLARIGGGDKSNPGSARSSDSKDSDIESAAGTAGAGTAGTLSRRASVIVGGAKSLEAPVR